MFICSKYDNSFQNHCNKGEKKHGLRVRVGVVDEDGPFHHQVEYSLEENSANNPQVFQIAIFGLRVECVQKVM